jgi:NTE family protein
LDDPSVLARTMFVDTMGIKATDFDIDSTKQDALAANGEEAARAFLKGWDFTKYVQEFR